jgi:hypothetical protein
MDLDLFGTQPLAAEPPPSRDPMWSELCNYMMRLLKVRIYKQVRWNFPCGLLWKLLQVVRYIFAVVFTLELIPRDMMEAGGEAGEV